LDQLDQRDRTEHGTDGGHAGPDDEGNLHFQFL
jgi:hypothetical protein